MSYEIALVGGVLGIAGLSYIMANEFKKEGNSAIYYLFLFISSISIPVTATVCQNIAEGAGVAEGLINLFVELSKDLWNLWFLVLIVTFIILLKAAFTAPLKLGKKGKEDND